MNDTTYLDFAENDYKYFMYSYKSGYVENNMAENAQNAAEKYLKYLIDRYDYDKERSNLKERVLRTHNLSPLLNYLSNEMNIQIPFDTRQYINALNSYYFNTGYPGENSFFVSRDDIEICKEGLETCRNFVLVLDKKWKKESDDKEIISKDTPIIEDEEWDI